MPNDDPQPYLIRAYRRSDREPIRRLCCDTGFLGEPIDPVYEDRELFADFLTTYYTDHEPESCEPGWRERDETQQELRDCADTVDEIARCRAEFFSEANHANVSALRSCAS